MCPVGFGTLTQRLLYIECHTVCTLKDPFVAAMSVFVFDNSRLLLSRYIGKIFHTGYLVKPVLPVAVKIIGSLYHNLIIIPKFIGQ